MKVKTVTRAIALEEDLYNELIETKDEKTNLSKLVNEYIRKGLNK